MDARLKEKPVSNRGWVKNVWKEIEAQTRVYSDKYGKHVCIYNYMHYVEEYTTVACVQAHTN